MKRTTLAVSTLVLAAVLAAPAVGQVNEQVARGATVTREFCANHTAMRDALFVRYVAGGSGKAGIASRFVRRPATDREAIGRLATVACPGRVPRLQPGGEAERHAGQQAERKELRSHGRAQWMALRRKTRKAIPRNSAV